MIGAASDDAPEFMIITVASHALPSYKAYAKKSTTSKPKRVSDFQPEKLPGLEHDQGSQGATSATLWRGELRCLGSPTSFRGNLDERAAMANQANQSDQPIPRWKCF